ncbi:DUF2057 family protein [Colwellia sp. E2M01]|uniref:YccT family protein n=1 Tax=Colwellia sp. E2M01 TaxID=2841561 RepID=UPI001C0A3AC4|nr:DUF2057 family protein [Colwellia sp. E2M01]MBU2871652.1 DUF2057 domain-containing protein [Colwellia sp. E2M01]
MSNIFINSLCSSLGCRYWLIFIIVNILSFNTVAADLTLSDNLVLRELDDKPINQSFFSQKQTFQLAKGEHSLIIKYKDVFEDMQLGEDRLVISELFVVKFTLSDQQNLLLTTSTIKNLAAAELFVKSPKLILQDGNQKELPLALQTLKEYRLAKEVNKQMTALSIQAANVTPESSLKNAVPVNNATNINEVDAIPMLKYWWQQATPTQKATFLKFINEDKMLTK